MINKKIIKYLYAGVINTTFGYILGVLLYLSIGELIDAYFVSIIAGFISIAFSICVHRRLVFKSQNNYLKDLFSGAFVYGFVIIYSGLVFKLAIDVFQWSIFLAQAVVLMQGWVISYILLNKITFRSSHV